MSWEASEGSAVAPLTGLTSMVESSAAEKTRADDYIMEMQQYADAEEKFASLVTFALIM